VEVAFKGNRKEFFLWDYPDPPPLHAAVIVDVDRGEDLGYIHALGDLAQKRNGGCSHGCGTSLPERKALRLASEKDRGLSKDLDRLNEDARRKAMERVKANGLGMKLSDAEWQWDRNKLTVYFTADKRVDFRNLVRELASHNLGAAHLPPQHAFVNDDVQPEWIFPGQHFLPVHAHLGKLGNFSG